MTCTKERTYEDGDWIITEKIYFVVGNQIDEYRSNPTQTDTGWLYTADRGTKHRTQILPNPLSDVNDSCLDNIPPTSSED